jgi:AraC-like DNA-binding protein
MHLVLRLSDDPLRLFDDRQDREGRTVSTMVLGGPRARFYKQSGYSHRRFITLFSRAVGLTPKAYCRVLRFQCVLRRARNGGFASLIDLAMASGYSDQSHFNREFRELTGVTPTEYRLAAPRAAHHVLVRSR